jgi:hypothetical protein
MNTFDNKKNGVFIVQSHNEHMGGKEMEPVGIDTFQEDS